ncbi:MAG: hypothetical protein DLM50_06875 [Candidatus Meridianibacter frigidus]|nr:MAG: hypothetical protein DLM50_06875 [Candidatus Eremiobacteraeota bacterium]
MRSAALLALLFALFGSAAHADCSSLQGRQVILTSNSYDPDVFVWDTKQRLIDYSAGNYQMGRQLLPHALLARAGTRGIVTSCGVNIVHLRTRFAPSDAVSIKLASGPYRGRYGWVLADDVRSAGGFRFLRPVTKHR